MVRNRSSRPKVFWKFFKILICTQGKTLDVDLECSFLVKFLINWYVQLCLKLTPSKILFKKTLWPFFMDGVQLPQCNSHFDEAVYFLPLSSQKFLVLNLSTSEGWKDWINLGATQWFWTWNPSIGNPAS